LSWLKGAGAPSATDFFDPVRQKVGKKIAALPPNVRKGSEGVKKYVPSWAGATLPPAVLKVVE
jgi:hypothetical protein